MKSKLQSIPSPPLSYQSQAQAVLIPTEMSVVDLWCVTLERLGCGYYCWWEHMVWVVWQAKPWQKSLKASADAATAQTSKWWHNCHCCSDATCFTVMTAMPFPKRLVAKQNPSLIPTDTCECEHTHNTHTQRHVWLHMRTCAHEIRWGLPFIDLFHVSLMV